MTPRNPSSPAAEFAVSTDPAPTPTPPPSTRSTTPPASVRRTPAVRRSVRSSCGHTGGFGRRRQQVLYAFTM